MAHYDGVHWIKLRFMSGHATISFVMFIASHGKKRTKQSYSSIDRNCSSCPEKYHSSASRRARTSYEFGKMIYNWAFPLSHTLWDVPFVHSLTPMRPERSLFARLLAAVRGAKF